MKIMKREGLGAASGGRWAARQSRAPNPVRLTARCLHDLHDLHGEQLWLGVGLAIDPAMTCRTNVESRERIVCVAAGVALGVYSLRRRKSASPIALASAAGLIARGVSGYCPANHLLGRGVDVGDTRHALAGSRGIRLEESVTIRATAASLYDRWRPLTTMPEVMRHVDRVEVIDERTSHWVVQGPAGMQFEWDAELINDVKPDLIAWRSLPGAEVVSAGSVNFRERQRRGGVVTELTVTLQYEPVGGKAASLLAWLIGQSPASMLREDLRRFKAQTEAGEAPTAGEAV